MGADKVMLLDWLIEDEDQKLTVYDDATGKALLPGMTLIGHPTVGIGRALDRKGLTKPETVYLCNNDMDGVDAELNEAFGWYAALDPVRSNVLASMSFNMGLHGLAAFHNMLTAVQQGKYAQAAEEMLASKWAGQVGDRAKRLALRMRTGLATP
jgi:lysozyme